MRGSKPANPNPNPNPNPNQAKFQLKTPLRELCESISTRLGGLDEELKTKLAEYNGVKGALQASERKAQGNLMVRNPNPNHP